MNNVFVIFVQGQVYMYYGLTNFYQNHRRYVKSRDDDQLRGEHISGNNLNSDCEPYKTYNDTSDVGIAPCGAIANSIFNGVCINMNRIKYIFDLCIK